MHLQIFERTKENILDDSLVKCFSPICVLQMLLGSSRIIIKNKMAIIPSMWDKLYTLICIVTVSFSFCYMAMTYYINLADKNATLFVTNIAGALVQYLSFSFNIINVRFFNSNLVVTVYNKLKKIDSILTLNEFEHLRKVQYYWNIFFLLLLVVPFGCGFAIYVINTVNYPILMVFASTGLLSVYLELLLAGSLIYYLTIRLRFLNEIIKYNLLVKYGDVNLCGAPIVVHQRYIISFDLNADNNALDLNKFLVCLKDILKLYKIINKLFSFPVFNIAVTLFCWSLLGIQAMIIGLRTKLVSVVTNIVIGFWIVYYIVLLMALAVVIHYFVQEVRVAKLCCIQAMSCNFEGPVWKGAKEILRTIQFSQPVFCVYGIFALDKSLPLKLVGIITTNVAVLIQFTIQT